jgi:hypothetical protein
MTRILLLIALLYVVFIYLPRRINRSMSGTPTRQRPTTHQEPKDKTSVTRVEEPRPRVLDTSDVSEAHYEEVEE